MIKAWVTSDLSINLIPYDEPWITPGLSQLYTLWWKHELPLIYQSIIYTMMKVWITTELSINHLLYNDSMTYFWISNQPFTLRWKHELQLDCPSIREPCIAYATLCESIKVTLKLMFLSFIFYASRSISIILRSQNQH